MATDIGYVKADSKRHNALPVNTTAGAKLVSRNQQQWYIMHNKSHASVAKVQSINSRFSTIDYCLSQRKEALSHLLESVRCFKDIKTSLSEISRDIDQLFHQFESIESHLTIMQDAKEQIDVAKFKEEQKAMIKDYTDAKNKQFEQTSRRMEREHRERVSDYEKRQEALMEERRRLHQQAFEEEMQRYLARTRKM